MKLEEKTIMQALPLSLVLLGLVFAIVAAITPVSLKKGLRRLLSSLLVGAAFILGSIEQIIAEHHLWPGAFGIGAGAFLVWIGYRKREKDPDGRTPAAKML
ncbi:hypothetical protein [Silvibacterium dinghuense]|uniref:Holin n=1 Tax=Silvibacterium dinghuense TaxID=1560006 RepID=A0A4Q1SJ29_9BACT|nr:hypothetical protein [Silvibacterium dinghuense]RXS97634.1 hypothetical protein ESZ00_07085 [Silvibacterium dinghuense]GGH00720.1 hypothetical protein GCM10011586_15380 [Silvibacterium dinghuense]